MVRRWADDIISTTLRSPMSPHCTVTHGDARCLFMPQNVFLGVIYSLNGNWGAVCMQPSRYILAWKRVTWRIDHVLWLEHKWDSSPSPLSIYLACSACLPEGLYVLLALILFRFWWHQLSRDLLGWFSRFQLQVVGTSATSHFESRLRVTSL